MTLEIGPLLIADSGPLIRLAAADMLDTMRLTNKQIVIVDRIKDEICGDISKPYAQEIDNWLEKMGETIIVPETATGNWINTLRQRVAENNTPEATTQLKRELRNSGERAIRDYIERLIPVDDYDALVLYEDSAVPALLQASRIDLTLMTTAAFASYMAEIGYNKDVRKALASTGYTMKPAAVTKVEANSDLIIENGD